MSLIDEHQMPQNLYMYRVNSSIPNSNTFVFFTLKLDYTQLFLTIIGRETKCPLIRESTCMNLATNVWKYITWRMLFPKDMPP